MVPNVVSLSDQQEEKQPECDNEVEETERTYVECEDDDGSTDVSTLSSGSARAKLSVALAAGVRQFWDQVVNGNSVNEKDDDVLTCIARSRQRKKEEQDRRWSRFKQDEAAVMEYMNQALEREQSNLQKKRAKKAALDRRAKEQEQQKKHFATAIGAATGLDSWAGLL